MSKRMGKEQNGLFTEMYMKINIRKRFSFINKKKQKNKFFFQIN